MSDFAQSHNNVDRKVTARKKFLATSNVSRLDIQIAVVGPFGVGKSALAVRYVTKRFIGDYDPKLESIYSFVDSIDGRDVNVRVMDTSDYKCSTLNHNRYLDWAHCVLVAFSVTSRRSFQAVEDYLTAWSGRCHLRGLGIGSYGIRRASIDSASSGKSGIQYRSSSDLSRIVGQWQPEEQSCTKSTAAMTNSLDRPALLLVGTKAELELDRCVSRSEIEDLARRFEVNFVEVSAAEDLDSVSRVFHEAIREAIHALESSSHFPEEKERISSFLAAVKTNDLLNSPRRLRKKSPGKQSNPPANLGRSALISLSRKNSPTPSSAPCLSSPASSSPTSSSSFLGSWRKESKENKFSIFRSKKLKGIFQ